MFDKGTVLDGRYEILDLMAAGGMGEVYRARRVLLGDEVAIKVLIPRADQGDSLRERFLRESRACAQLRHPHIVSILDFDVDERGRPFLVMEYLNGPSLRQELATYGRFDLAHVRRVVQALAGALQLAHDRGIVHRDLKPANVVSHRYETGEVVYKLIDFGIANIRESDETRLTGQREFLGTVAYASPEQIRGEAVDARADIYSLAAMVFELLTGQPPFPAGDVLALATQHLTAAPPPPSAIVPDVPRWLDEALLKALAKDRQQRWANVTTFARALSGEPDEATTTQLALPADAPSWLAKYELRQLVGKGRFGSEIFAGVHRALGHPVAIRTLRRRQHPRWDAARDRFLREAQALQISHPSVMQVRDYGEEGDIVYVVTELFEGRSLREALVREGFLSWPRLSRLLGQLLSAASAIHRRGGLLSGLMPEIIRMTEDEDGERLLVSSGGVCHTEDLMALLSEETLRGAGRPDPELYYAAPELLLGQAPDERSDVFTLGALAYEMATGRRPYEAATYPMLLGAMLRTTPADPRTVQPDLPVPFVDAIRRALSADRDARPATASALGAAGLAPA